MYTNPFCDAHSTKHLRNEEIDGVQQTKTVDLQNPKGLCSCLTGIETDIVYLTCSHATVQLRFPLPDDEVGEKTQLRIEKVKFM